MINDKGSSLLDETKRRKRGKRKKLLELTMRKSTYYIKRSTVLK